MTKPLSREIIHIETIEEHTMKVNSTGWKQEMDKLYKDTLKNWKNMKEVKKSSGVSGSISLGSAILK